MLRKNKNLLEKKKEILFRLDLAVVSFLFSFNSFVVSLSVSFWEFKALLRILSFKYIYYNKLNINFKSY